MRRLLRRIRLRIEKIRFTTLQMMGFVLACACVLGPIACMLKYVNDEGKGFHESACTINMIQITRALHQYHEDFGCFPPAYVVDATGKPIHSWRVLVLASMEENRALFEQYDLNEPWDGPNNRLLADKMPSVYSCRSRRPAEGKTMTNYVALTGPGTVFPLDKTVRVTDIADGPDQTIFLVEVADAGINWMEPRDLDVSKLDATSPALLQPRIRSQDPHGPILGFVSGRRLRSAQPIANARLKAMATIDGGEVLDSPD